MLEDHGVPVIDADSIGHAVLQPDGPAFDEVAERWPDVLDDGFVNRRRLGEIVFADEDELAALESITHPYIFDLIRSRVEEFDGGVVVEMPLLGRRLDESWGQIVVDARDEVRLQRAMSRGMTKVQALSRMRAQPSRSEWLASADLVIPNHTTLRDLHSTVDVLVPKL